MGRGPAIRNETRIRIVELHNERPDWHAHDIMENLNKEMLGKGPGLSAVQKELTPVRHREKAEGGKGLAAPWSLGSLPDYEIPPDALPAVIREANKRQDYGEHISIREALWIARFSSTIKDEDELAWWSSRFAERERACELLDIPLEAADIETAMIAGLIEHRPAPGHHKVEQRILRSPESQNTERGTPCEGT